MQPIQPNIKEQTKSDTDVDANGWPIGFFEETAGSIPDFPEREHQGEYEERLELDDLVNGITTENQHTEFDFGMAQGQEQL